MSGYEFIYRLTMCNLQIYASTFVAISIIMSFYFIFYFSFARRLFLAITPPKYMQGLLFYRLRCFNLMW